MSVFLGAKSNTYEVRKRVSKLNVELIYETLDQPIAVNGIINNLLHGSADRQEVFILIILEMKR